MAIWPSSSSGRHLQSAEALNWPDERLFDGMWPVWWNYYFAIGYSMQLFDRIHRHLLILNCLKNLEHAYCFLRLIRLVRWSHWNYHASCLGPSLISWRLQNWQTYSSVNSPRTYSHDLVSASSRAQNITSHYHWHYSNLNYSIYLFVFNLMLLLCVVQFNC